jgi:hypothetical protein
MPYLVHNAQRRANFFWSNHVERGTSRAGASIDSVLYSEHISQKGIESVWPEKKVRHNDQRDKNERTINRMLDDGLGGMDSRSRFMRRSQIRTLRTRNDGPFLA